MQKLLKLFARIAAILALVYFFSALLGSAFLALGVSFFYYSWAVGSLGLRSFGESALVYAHMYVVLIYMLVTAIRFFKVAKNKPGKKTMGMFGMVSGLAFGLWLIIAHVIGLLYMGEVAMIGVVWLIVMLAIVAFYAYALVAKVMGKNNAEVATEPAAEVAAEAGAEQVEDKTEND